MKQVMIVAVIITIVLGVAGYFVFDIGQQSDYSLIEEVLFDPGDTLQPNAAEFDPASLLRPEELCPPGAPGCGLLIPAYTRDDIEKEEIIEEGGDRTEVVITLKDGTVIRCRETRDVGLRIIRCTVTLPDGSSYTSEVVFQKNPDGSEVVIVHYWTEGLASTVEQEVYKDGSSVVIIAETTHSAADGSAKVTATTTSYGPDGRVIETRTTETTIGKDGKIISTVETVTRSDGSRTITRTDGDGKPEVTEVGPTGFS